ncbi:MAG: dTDP-4-dehydrorhamnose 3,5-epimerase [Porticoccaceae bacterium]|nr:dTDP-4-dehydrorhamnose 3,5-epimerase [Porticoccaceae bacterium]
MRFTPLAIPDVILIEPNVFADERGFFYESFNLKVFEKGTGLRPDFVQDNHSLSIRGVMRGLHYQVPPREQAKLVRVVQGEIFDVSVDIRRNSPTFGQWVGETLSAENKKQMWIPQGFAHGFLTLSETASLVYKTTDYYSAEDERCIAWNDPDIHIEWPLSAHPLLSDKDRKGSDFDAI